MALGGVKKKLQQVTDMADELYGRLEAVREEVGSVRDSVERTEDRVGRIERRLDQQAALIEAIASDRGIDVEEVSTRAAIEEAEASGGQQDGDGAGGTD